jgi:hypothetical protein
MKSTNQLPKGKLNPRDSIHKSRYKMPLPHNRYQKNNSSTGMMMMLSDFVIGGKCGHA